MNYNYCIIKQTKKTITAFQDINTNRVIEVGDCIKLNHISGNKSTYKTVIDKEINNVDSENILLFVK